MLKVCMQPQQQLIKAREPLFQAIGSYIKISNVVCPTVGARYVLQKHDYKNNNLYLHSRL